MPTGGFTATQLSIEAYHSWRVECIVIAFMVLAAVNFRLYYFAFWKRRLRNFFTDPELRVYIALLIGASLFITLDLIGNAGFSISSAFRYGSFNAVSIMTTTGFCTTDFNVWPAFSKATLIALMIIGGSAGSTAGAIKVMRVIVVAKCIYRQILQLINPRSVITLRVGKLPITEKQTSEALGMSSIYLIVLVVAFLIMSAVGLDQVTAFSSVAACMGTVGPGIGSVGPLANYFWIPPLGKIVLIMCMLLGRLEMLAVLSLFIPSFWKWR